jgi:phosphoglucosamine mutase
MRNSLFGTDGVRGEANTHPMTVETGVALGRAIAHAFRTERERPRILIGKDTRISGYLFENALAAGICSVGGDAYLMGPMPTPGVAFLTVNMRAAAGVVISASHNAYHDNGIKFFGYDGFKLNDELENRIAEWVTRGETQQFTASGADIGKAHRVRDVLGRYVVFLKHTFPQHLRLDGLKICVDCANGAAYKAAPLVFTELGAQVTAIGVSPNGTNINESCGATAPERLQQKVKETGSDIGIALDGDADRCILVDENGDLIDGDQILGMSALWYQQNGQLKNDAVVATVMSNLGLENALKAEGIDMVRCQVGDRQVVAAMRQGDYVIGGEQSGHMVYLNHSTTGDGIVTALQVIAQMLQTQKPLSELTQFYTPYPQVLRNLKVAKKTPISELTDAKKCIKSAEENLGEEGRILVRYSGTEPKVRVMGEGTDLARVEREVDKICTALQSALVANN